MRLLWKKLLSYIVHENVELNSIWSRPVSEKFCAFIATYNQRIISGSIHHTVYKVLYAKRSPQHGEYRNQCFESNSWSGAAKNGRSGSGCRSLIVCNIHQKYPVTWNKFCDYQFRVFAKIAKFGWFLASSFYNFQDNLKRISDSESRLQ